MPGAVNVRKPRTKRVETAAREGRVRLPSVCLSAPNRSGNPAHRRADPEYPIASRHRQPCICVRHLAPARRSRAIGQMTLQRRTRMSEDGGHAHPRFCQRVHARVVAVRGGEHLHEYSPCEAFGAEHGASAFAKQAADLWGTANGNRGCYGANLFYDTTLRNNTEQVLPVYASLFCRNVPSYYGAVRIEQPSGSFLRLAETTGRRSATTPWSQRAQTSGSSSWSAISTSPTSYCGSSESTSNSRRCPYPGAPCVSNRSLLNDDQSSVSADALFASISTYRATAWRSPSSCGANLNPKVCTPASSVT